MKLQTTFGHVFLLLLYVALIFPVESKREKSVREKFEEYMENGAPSPTRSPNEMQVSPPKVWRRKRDVKEGKVEGEYLYNIARR